MKEEPSRQKWGECQYDLCHMYSGDVLSEALSVYDPHWSFFSLPGLGSLYDSRDGMSFQVSFHRVFPSRSVLIQLDSS
jgi:hypothetical protein